jgi:multidrug resistance efflux pump
VQRSDELVRLDTTTLQAQQDQLAAALETARANLAEVSAPPRPEDVAAAAAEFERARAARRGAFNVWQEALAQADNPLELNLEVESARSQVAILEKEVEAAQAELKEAQIRRDEAARNQLNHEAMVMSQVAEKQAAAAQASLAAAEAELAGAREQRALLEDMRDRPLALVAQANAAGSAYEQAVAGAMAAEEKLALVKAGPRPEDVAIAEAEVDQAEAALARVEVQLARMTLDSPIDGVVTERVVDPGELAAPGSALLNVGDLDQVKLTVFIPETKSGRVKVGQAALVDVDAYPNQTFQGCVTYIAPEAEFTPKNVQTEEERVNQVFAVEISLDNPGHELKPGMPADAEIMPDTTGCVP